MNLEMPQDCMVRHYDTCGCFGEYLESCLRIFGLSKSYQQAGSFLRQGNAL